MPEALGLAERSRERADAGRGRTAGAGARPGPGRAWGQLSLRLPAGQQGSVDLRWASTADRADGPFSDPGLLADLDAETVARADRMMRPADRRRTLVAHALLRRAVGPLLGVAPRSLQVSRSCDRCGSADHGRPFVVQGPGSRSPGSIGHRAQPPVEVSLAHSGDLAVVTVAPAGVRVGVDVEPRQLDAARRRAYASVLPAALLARADAFADPDDGYVRAWTGLEAVVKATGYGLSDQLAADPARGPAGIDPLAPPMAGGWAVVTAVPSRVAFVELLPPGGDEPYLAAVAVLDPSAALSPSTSSKGILR